jgi:hypothetical protein
MKLKLPQQSKPIVRDLFRFIPLPKDREQLKDLPYVASFIQPYTVVDLEWLEKMVQKYETIRDKDKKQQQKYERLRKNLVDLRYGLLHGANYNDPMYFSSPVELCGCHILSASRAACLAMCAQS